MLLHVPNILPCAFEIMGRAEARPSESSSLRPATPGAYVPDLMRLFLRRAGLILATGSLVFFLSCERHHVGELPDQLEKTKAPAEEHAATTPVPPTSSSPAARNTPANFFPDKPKP